MKKVNWYILSACVWIFIFPITGITAWAFIISGPICILASIVKFVFKLFGIDLIWITNSSFNLGIFGDLILSLLVGIILTLAGLLLWKLTKKIYKWLNLIKPTVKS